MTKEEQREIAFDIFASGGTREEVAEALGVCRKTISNYIRNDDDFKQMHIEAKQLFADELTEKLMSKAQAPLPANPKLAGAEVQRRRLEADNIKWISSKLLPKVYGDKLHLEGEVNHTLSPLAQLRLLETQPEPAKIAPSPPVIEVDLVEAEEEIGCF